MQMKASTISEASSDSCLGEQPTFKLSGHLSEWLFSSRFWQDFNTRHGTFFDQFEEDEVGSEVVEKIAAAMDDRIEELARNDNPIVEFVYRQLADGTALTASIAKADLADELFRLRSFLRGQAQRGATLILSL